MKYLSFKNLEVFSRGGFIVTTNKLYEVNLSADDIQFSVDDNGTSIGISIYADPLVVEIVDDNGLTLNQVFVDESTNETLEN